MSLLIRRNITILKHEKIINYNKTKSTLNRIKKKNMNSTPIITIKFQYKLHPK